MYILYIYIPKHIKQVGTEEWNYYTAKPFKTSVGIVMLFFLNNLRFEPVATCYYHGNPSKSSTDGHGMTLVIIYIYIYIQCHFITITEVWIVSIFVTSLSMSYLLIQWRISDDSCVCVLQEDYMLLVRERRYFTGDISSVRLVMFPYQLLNDVDLISVPLVDVKKRNLFLISHVAILKLNVYFIN